jgi:hypothetical protein
MTVQSIIFDKKIYNLGDCINWLISNGFSHNKVDESKNYYRFRQKKPNRRYKYSTIEITNGIKLIIKQ